MLDTDPLVEIVGPGNVQVDSELTRSSRTDWTGRFTCGPVPVVRPGSADEVRRLLALANRLRVPVVTQGGNTGLVGGGVPTTDAGMILSTRRLNAIGAIDHLGGHVTVGAGVVLGDLQRSLKGSGLIFGVDLGARDSCTIGGMVATNAGGINFLRYGSMRRQVVGVEAVLGDATLVSHLNGLEKDNTGYDLEGLLTGSEGTLGVVTRVLLRLWPEQDQVTTAFLRFPDPANAIEAAMRLKRSVSTLDAMEFMLEAGLQLVRDAFGPSFPGGSIPPAVLLVESSGGDRSLAELAEACDAVNDLTLDEPSVATDGSCSDVEMA